jgi:hypothetical protein
MLSRFFPRALCSLTFEQIAPIFPLGPRGWTDAAGDPENGYTKRIKTGLTRHELDHPLFKHRRVHRTFSFSSFQSPISLSSSSQNANVHPCVSEPLEARVKLDPLL